MGTGNPNVAAMPLIDDAVLAVPAIFPDAQLQTKLETITARNAKQRRIINRLWAEIKIR